MNNAVVSVVCHVFVRSPVTVARWGYSQFALIQLRWLANTKHVSQLGWAGRTALWATNCTRQVMQRWFSGRYSETRGSRRATDVSSLVDYVSPLNHHCILILNCLTFTLLATTQPASLWLAIWLVFCAAIPSAQLNFWNSYLFKLFLLPIFRVPTKIQCVVKMSCCVVQCSNFQCLVLNVGM